MGNWKDEIVCPYCGDVKDPSDYDYEVCQEGQHVYDCGVCENEITINTYIEISYNVTK